MKYSLKYLISTIDKNNRKYKTLKKILVKKKPINHEWSDENTLNQSIKAVFDNNDIDRFNPGIIELLFKRGAQCINPSGIYNTLNIAIISSNQYIELFEDDKTKLIAEQNAIKVIDIVIKHGALPRVYDCEESNTLAIAMNCANINILKFLISTNLDLNLEFYDDHDYSSRYLLDCALSASHKTRNPEFFRIALINGAVPYHNATDDIFASTLITIFDCIVFGGYNFINHFSSHFNAIMSKDKCEKITEEKKMEIFEIITCMDGSVLPFTQCISAGPLREFIRGCRKLFKKKYLRYDKDSIEYKNALDIKNRLAMRIRWLIDIAQSYEKNNGRQEIIENEIVALPIALIDIISGYEYTPRFTTIDLSEYQI